MNSWSANQFMEDIGSLITSFNTSFLPDDVSAAVSNPHGDRKASLRMLTSLDLISVQKNLNKLLYTIEEELRRNAILCLSDYGCSENKTNNILYDLFYSGFIRSPLIDELNSTLQHLKDLCVLASEHLKVLERNSGLGGLFRGFYKGFNNPVDGLSHAFGQGSMQVEVNSSVRHFNATSIMVGQSIDSVSSSLHSVVLEKWNHFGNLLEKGQI